MSFYIVVCLFIGSDEVWVNIEKIMLEATNSGRGNVLKQLIATNENNREEFKKLQEMYSDIKVKYPSYNELRTLMEENKQQALNESNQIVKLSKNEFEKLQQRINVLEKENIKLRAAEKIKKFMHKKRLNAAMFKNKITTKKKTNKNNSLCCFIFIFMLCYLRFPTQI